MTLYVCIYNRDTGATEYAEELPFDTDEEKDWARRWGVDRLDLECRSRGGDTFKPYHSTDGQFVWVDPATVVTP